jgi:hypothetical protein
LLGELGAALAGDGQRVSVGERLTVLGTGAVSLGAQSADLGVDAHYEAVDVAGAVLEAGDDPNGPVGAQFVVVDGYPAAGDSDQLEA